VPHMRMHAIQRPTGIAANYELDVSENGKTAACNKLDLIRAWQSEPFYIIKGLAQYH
jgi:hypothetical protein